MTDQKLVNYINQQLRSGKDINIIRNALIQQGWNQNTVDDSINYVNNQNIKNQKEVLQWLI